MDTAEVWEQAVPEPPPDLRRQPRRARPQERQPPHSTEAELGVLGCIMLEPRYAMPKIAAFMDPQWFYDLRHQKIYATLCDLWEQRAPIDIIVLAEVLKGRKQLDECGGLVYLSRIPDSTPSAKNVLYYTKMMRESWMLRRTLEVCTDACGRAYELEDQKADDFIMDVQQGLRTIREAYLATEDTGFVDIQSTNQALYAYYEDAKTRGDLAGLRTGYPDVDKIVGGLRDGELVIVAARPSVGKTTLAMNIAENLVIHGDVPVGVFSMEMSAQQLLHRTACSIARVNSRTLDVGKADTDETRRISNALAKINGAKNRLYISEKGGMSAADIEREAKKMIEQFGVKLLIVDYLQLVRVMTNRGIYESTTETVHAMKRIAKEYDVPMILLSQITRSSEKEGRPPRLSDLRNSGAIEEDADVIMFLHPMKGDMEEKDWVLLEQRPMQIMISKNRNGATGWAELEFFHTFTRFESATKLPFNND